MCSHSPNIPDLAITTWSTHRSGGAHSSPGYSSHPKTLHTPFPTGIARGSSLLERASSSISSPGTEWPSQGGCTELHSNSAPH